MAFISGTFLPLPAGLNSRMGKAAGSIVSASLMSFVVGAIGLIIYVLITRQTVSWSGEKEVRGYRYGSEEYGEIHLVRD